MLILRIRGAGEINITQIPSGRGHNCIVVSPLFAKKPLPLPKIYAVLPSVYIQDYAYNLPDQQIARYPASPRDASRLLIYRHGEISGGNFLNLANHLPQGAMLVFNNTRVIPARLTFRTHSGAVIEIFCLAPYAPSGYEQSLQSTQSCVWTCLAGNQKRWRDEPLHCGFAFNGSPCTLTARRVQAPVGNAAVEFGWTGGCTFAEALECCGVTPLPPYLRRPAESADCAAYQTIYARHRGSVAAPTAGLHFTERVFNSLKINNIHTAEITLHVGAGTFLPVKTPTANAHPMHSERFVAGLEFLEKLRANLGSIIAVGTTSARTLESIHWLGCMLLKYNRIPLHLAQWDAYDIDPVPAAEHTLDALAGYLKVNGLRQIECSTSLMIMPPYRFRVVNGLITNFHQPQSTLLLLVGALTGGNWRGIYHYALEQGFRFLSYGDCSLIIP